VADDAQQPFKDAEAWLAARGIERDPIEVPLEPPEPVEPTPAGTTAAAGDVSTQDAGTPGVSARDAARLAGQAETDAQAREGDERALPDPDRPSLEADISEALAFIRNSTAAAPQSEGRLRTKIAERGWSDVVAEAALDRARRERLVDDAALAAALVEERRARGHAVARIRRDLRDRGFDATTLDGALASAAAEDPEAAAFEIAAGRAARLTALPAEAAFRRVVGFVVRRGYPDGLARKVAREAVFTAREQERTAGH
jgi:regulatory protein